MVSNLYSYSKESSGWRRRKTESNGELLLRRPRLTQGFSAERMDGWMDGWMDSYSKEAGWNFAWRQILRFRFTWFTYVTPKFYTVYQHRPL
jgi:hypothetical protein